MRCLSWICIDYFFSLFFPLAAKLIGPKTGCQFQKNVDFFGNGPLNCVVLEAAFLICMCLFIELRFYAIFLSVLDVLLIDETINN